MTDHKQGSRLHDVVGTTSASNSLSRKLSVDDRKWTTMKRKLCMNIRGFVACLAALQFVQVMGSGYSKSVLTSIERRYQLDTFQIGILQSCFHVGNLSVILLVSYFGSKWHRPRAIAIGSLVMAISSLLSSMPQFIGGTYRPLHFDVGVPSSRVEVRVTDHPRSDGHTPSSTTEVSRSTKNLNNTNTSSYLARSRSDETRNMFDADKRASGYEGSVCRRGGNKAWKSSTQEPRKTDEDTESSLYALIAVGGVLKGMGHTPLHPLGMSFIDDYAARGNSAFYIGIVSALSLLGPAFGFLLGSFTTSLWVDTGWTSTTIRYDDRFGHMWVGAWWIGYLLMAVLLLLAAIPFYWFPRVIKKEEDDVITSCMICENGLKFGKKLRKKKKKFGSHKGTENHDEISFKYSSDEKHDDVCREDDITIECRRTLSFSANAASNTSDMTSQIQRTRSAPNLVARLSSKGCQCNGQGEILYTREGQRGELSRQFSSSIRDFTCTLVNLLTDPVFASITLGYVSLTSFLASSITYMSKYMESQFGRSASFANLINGSVNLPLAVLGNVAGGMIMRTRNLNVKQTISLVLCSLVVTIACIGALLLFGCDGESVMGIDHTATSHCYDECHCKDEFYPVCDVTTNITYRSACIAGCTQTLDNKGYTNCSCLVGDMGMGSVRTGYCNEKSCSGLLMLFISMMGMASLSSGMAATPSTLSILRVAPSNDKALAIGVVFVFTRVLAWIPSPVYIGFLIDSSCLLWSQNEDNSQQKHCEIYNKRWLRHRMFGAIAVQVTCAIFFYSLSYYLVTRHKSARRSATAEDVLLANGKANRETPV